jgi:hypothetical protein
MGRAETFSRYRYTGRFEHYIVDDSGYGVEVYAHKKSAQDHIPHEDNWIKSLDFVDQVEPYIIEREAQLIEEAGVFYGDMLKELQRDMCIPDRPTSEQYKIMSEAFSNNSHLMDVFKLVNDAGFWLCMTEYGMAANKEDKRKGLDFDGDN